MTASESGTQDGQESLSIHDIIDRQHALEQEARDVLGFDPSECTSMRGPLRQPVYSCKTCGNGGVCAGCSITCHGEHDLVELFMRRDFSCDCGTVTCGPDAFCSISKRRSAPANPHNKYGPNFKNMFCVCKSSYDPEKEEDEMVQCLVCEDWIHTRCLNIPEFSSFNNDDYDTLLCHRCVKSNDALRKILERWAGSDGSGVMILDKAGNPLGKLKDKDDIVSVKEDATSVNGASVKEDAASVKDDTVSLKDDSSSIAAPPTVSSSTLQLDDGLSLPSSGGSDLLRLKRKASDILDAASTADTMDDAASTASITSSTPRKVKRARFDDAVGASSSASLASSEAAESNFAFSSTGGGPATAPVSPGTSVTFTSAATLGSAPSPSAASTTSFRFPITGGGGTSAPSVIYSNSISSGCQAPLPPPPPPQSSSSSSTTLELGSGIGTESNLKRLEKQGLEPDVFLADGWIERWCRCSKCLVDFEPFPYLLEEEETYEPPEDSQPHKSLYDLGTEALNRMPRDKAIEGSRAYNGLRDKLMAYLRPFADRGEIVTSEKIQTFFDKAKLTRSSSSN